MSVGVIGGSGFYEFSELRDKKILSKETQYGVVEEIVFGKLGDVEIFYFPRHGKNHFCPPHKVNYRANISALKELGVECIFSVNATGGIGEDMAPGTIVLPTQVIDYTHGREHTFFDGTTKCEHIDFSHPFCKKLQASILKSTKNIYPKILLGGTYGCTQGPRLETGAEISRLKRDGCDLVGMTVMPEAALAREMNIDYVSICINANWAAGIKKELVSIDEIFRTLEKTLSTVKAILITTITNLK